jgi:hypothetical protein
MVSIPGSARVALYIASLIGANSGAAYEDTDTLLSELAGHAAQRRFVFTHRWRVGDRVMWDNHRTMHGVPILTTCGGSMICNRSHLRTEAMRLVPRKRGRQAQASDSRSLRSICSATFPSEYRV